jgi:uncharacterized protein DUF2000
VVRDRLLQNPSIQAQNAFVSSVVQILRLTYSTHAEHRLTLQTDNPHTTAVPEIASPRCVIVIDDALPPGKACNAAAVIALTIGERHPYLVGAPLIDARNVHHPGLIPVGISVLKASAGQLSKLRADAREKDFDFVGFPVQGQQTKDYTAFRDAVRAVDTHELAYVGVGIVGDNKALRKLVSDFELMQ